jgi:hypothetical protein
MKGSKGYLITAMCNAIAASCAGAANCYFMRQKEMKKGVQV